MIPNWLRKLVTARNVLLLQLALLIVVLVIGLLGWSGAFSSFGADTVSKLARWIHRDHYARSLRIDDADVAGYVNHHSVPSGASFKLFLSTVGDSTKTSGTLEFSRVGYHDAGDRLTVYRSEKVSVVRQKTSMTSLVGGAAWRPLDDEISTRGWRSGYYAIDFVDDDGTRARDIAFIVVTNPKRAGDVLIKLSTNTYQAYNEWGGSSLYQSSYGAPHADVLSFDRPTRTGFYDWEYYYVLWIEEFAAKNGLTVDYATNHDLHANPDMAKDYTVLMSVGHDEYWTQEEFDAYYDRIFRQGKHTMFLSGNTAYWRIRYGDLNRSGQGRQLICYRTPMRFEGDLMKAMYDPIRFTDGNEHAGSGVFRGEIGYPETMLMGVEYESYFDDSLGGALRYGYKVKTVLPWLFEGTGLKPGDHLADVIGYEWDNSSLDFRGMQVWSEDRSRIPELPREKLQIVFEGEVVNFAGEPGLAQAVYFESDAGAKVFSAGTIRWSWGLRKPDFAKPVFETVNKNLLEHFLKDAKRP